MTGLWTEVCVTWPTIEMLGAGYNGYGAALAVLRPNIKALVYFVIPVPLWIVIAGSFLLLSFIPNVAWQAHLGGLIVGLIAGFLVKRKPRERDRYLL